MRYRSAAAIGILLMAAAVVLVASREEPQPTPPPPSPSGTLTARVISWDIGFHPATQEEWIDTVATEVRAAAGADIILFPELFASALADYARDSVPYEFVTRQMLEQVLPAVKAAAGPETLVCLGSYPHQVPGCAHARNRSPVLLGGVWHFVDKLHPTQGEAQCENPRIVPGDVLPVFRFRGGTVAVAICFSLEMPELSAALKREGIHLLLGPTATEDEDGVARILRTSSARAVELGAAVLVGPLVGEHGSWKTVGSAALYLPAQKGIDHRPRESPRRTSGIARDDFVIPWEKLLELRKQPANQPETRPFLVPDQPFRVERR